MGKRYLVTGGAGFIGSHIVRRLVGQGELVRVVDNLSTGQSIRLKDVRDSIEFVEGDLADERVSDEVVRGVDYVLHQAAVPSVQRSVYDPIGTNRVECDRDFESSRKLPEGRCSPFRLRGIVVRLWRYRGSPQSGGDVAESTLALCVTEIGRGALLQAIL